MMPARTVADARQVLDDYTPTLTPEARKQWTSEIASAEAEMRDRGMAAVDRMTDEHVPAARAISETLATTRDEARQLTDDIRSGRISDTDAAARLEQLRSQVRRSRTAGETLTAKADAIDAIEADPIAHAEAMAARFPAARLLHNFSF
ncbi:hypothetical protein [Ilumatobacter coccineus]|uniref:Uncharacterized protein n=1 Tax=Ilumatobacter coccineus (strain NBRC 103263 / KCTC 29153 / YM16-304) TaxID=1313172 RepID=A0A6C7EAJ2_ILUCY|nr:hypothetical protein [Ilumatobacter coccineus]BAN03353.1 hypothetical protein YM304_30390 [Ilumatobacter coccineus YM16-304]